MPPTQQIQRFQSSDAEEVAATWARFAPSSKLLRVDRKRCSLDWFSASTEGFSIIKYRMAADVRSSVEPEGQLFSCRMTADEGGSWSGRDELNPSLPWASDGSLVEADWTGSATVHALVFERDHAMRLARQMSGDDTLSVRVKSPEAVSAAAAAQWDRALGYLASSIVSASGAIDGSSLLEAGLQRHALWVFLTTFPTTFSDTMRRSVQTTAAPRTVRRALAYMDAHAQQPITIDDVARAVHISTRGLQHAFRRSLDFTPSEYLRRARLSGAREDLLAAAPHETVTCIARRWGYSNAARFAAYYREEFGEHPLQTLRGR